MSKCLVERLDTILSDSSLPVIEIMQPVTLAAISKSGNSSMTSAQKNALNHLFYVLGAVDNNTLWQHLNYLLLPIISATEAAALSDYKNDGVTLQNDNRFVQKIGGLRVQFNEQDVDNETSVSLKNSNISSLDIKNSTLVVSTSYGVAKSGSFVTETLTGSRLLLSINSSKSSGTFYDHDNQVRKYYSAELSSEKSIACVSASDTVLEISGCNATGDVEHIAMPHSDAYDNAVAISSMTSKEISFRSRIVYSTLLYFDTYIAEAKREEILKALQALEVAFNS